MTESKMNPALKRLLYCFAGLIVGVLAALLLTLIALYLFPLLTGLGSDEMSQGIMGTLLMIFAAPILGLAGVAIAYKHSIKND